MTKLTKTARQEVLNKVLKEVFEPKFADLKKRLVQYVKCWLQTNHPVFVELLARKDAREYLSVMQFYRLYVSGAAAHYPNYGHDELSGRITVNEITVPSICVDSFVVGDNDITLTYESLWDTYRSAHSELTKILAAYKTYEALLVDFPEYATYLPAPVVKQLPAVIPSESRARLSALGIPASK